MGANKVYSNFAQENGFTYDKDTGMIYGRASGRSFCAVKASPSTNYLKLTFAAKRGESPDAEESEELINKTLCSNSKALGKQVTINGSNITFTVMAGMSMGASVKNLRTALDEVAAFLTTNGFTDCCEKCGTTMGVTPCSINDQGHMLCSGCYSEVSTALEQNQKLAKGRKGSLLTGLVGALLGSLLGVAAIVVISQLGYVAAISGVIMGVCTLKGYELLGGKATVLGMILCSLLMVVMVLVGDSIDWALLLVNEFDVTFVEGYQAIPALLLEDIIPMGDYLLNLVQLYAFTALGAVPAILNFFRQKNGSYKAKQMA